MLFPIFHVKLIYSLRVDLLCVCVKETFMYVLYIIVFLVLSSFDLLSLQYIADNRLENNPWHGVDEWALKVVKNYNIII